MTFTRRTIEVYQCKYANFGESSELFSLVQAHDVEYDAPTIDLRIPAFQFKLLNPGGVTRFKWGTSDVIKIYENKQLVFTGSVNKIFPTKDNKSGQILVISGIQYYYRVLIDNLTNTAVESDGGVQNIWRYGRKQNNNGTTVPDMIDGLNPAQILKALSGNKMYIQEFFDNHDNIDDDDWSLNPTVFTDYTVRITNQSFESTIGATWTPFWKTGGVGLTASTYSLSSINTFVNSARVVDNPYLGTASYKFSAPTSAAMNIGDGIGIFQDNVLLNPGDTLYCYLKSVDFNAELVSLGARILVFKNSDSGFKNPITQVGGDPLVISSKYSGVSTTYAKLGGNVNIQVSGNYRIAVMLNWTGSSKAATANALDIRVDNFKIIRTTNFNNVILGQGGFLQLMEVGRNSPLMAENFDVTASIPTPLSTWTQTPNGGSISLIADARVTSPPVGVTPKVVQLTGGASNPANMQKNLTNIYTKDMVFKFEANPAQINKNSYPLVLLGTDKNNVSRTIYPFVFRSDGSIGYIDQNGAAAQYFITGSTTTSYAANTWASIRISYIANSGKFTVFMNESFVGTFSVSFSTGTLPIISFTSAKVIAGDTGGAGTLLVDNMFIDSLTPPKIYAFTGTAESKDFFVGNQNIKVLPEFKGNFNVKVLAYPYKYNPSNTSLQYDPQLQIIFKHSTANPLVQTTVLTTSILTPTSITPVNGSGLMQYQYSFAISGLPGAADMARLRFTLNSSGDASHIGDGLGTPLVDYYLIDADVNNYTRQVKYVSGVQTYRGLNTGISTDISGIADYVFPADLLQTPDASFSTTAIEFFQQNLLKCMGDLLQLTVKPTSFDNTILTNLPAGTLLYPQDPNWDLQIDNTGKITFAKIIGNYYGKLAGSKKKEYSFRYRNLTKIAVEFDDAEIYNQIVFIGQGIAGQNQTGTTTTTNDYLTVKDDTSINTYGLRIGRIVDKKVFDQYTAAGKAYSALRLHKNPIQKVTVTLLPGFNDQWNIGDIIYIRDLDEGVDDDFRVLTKKTKIDDQGGASITVELSTKNKTVASFVDSVSGHLGSMVNANQGSLVTAVGGGVPKTVTRDSPYVVQVVIPDNAASTLRRILLDVHSEAAYNTATITDQEGQHTHGIPALTVPIPALTVPIPALTVPSTAVNAITSGSNVPSNSVAIVNASGSATQGNGTEGTYNGGTTLGVDNSGGTNDNSMVNNEGFLISFFVQDVNSSITSGGRLRIKAYLRVHQSGFDTDLEVFEMYNTMQQGGTYNIEGLHIPASFLKSHNNLNVVGGFIRVGNDTGVTITNFSWGVFVDRIPTHTHVVSGQTTSATTTSTSSSTTSTSSSTTAANTTSAGSAHNHTLRFGVFYNRNSQGQLLFPTNVNVSVNDIDGIGVIPTTANGGPIVGLMGLGTAETGDYTEFAQARNIGFLVQDRDISYAFKDASGKWISGTHYLYFRANGFENQVNDSNVGILQANIKYDVAQRTNDDLNAPAPAPQL